MELLDIIVLVLFVAGLVSGIKEGLVKQVMGLVGFIAGLFIGKAIYLSVAEKLTPFLGVSEKTTRIIAFALILILVPLLFSLIAWLISKFLKSVGLGWVNRLLGGLVSIVTTALVIGLVFVGIESFDTNEVILSKEKKESSIFFTPLSHTAGVLIQDVRKEISEWRQAHDSEDEACDDDTRDDSNEKKKEEKRELQSFEEVV